MEADTMVSQDDKRIWKTIYLWLLFLALTAHAQVSPRKQLHFASEEGLAHQVIHCILQDREGFMWFGTRRGLIRSDGYRLTPFRNNPDVAASLSSDWVNTLYQDHSGILWIGTGGGGLDRFDPHGGPGGWVFSHFRYVPENPASLSHNQVSAILEDKKGVLWIGTDAGLNRFDRENQRFTRLYSDKSITSLSDNRIRCLYEDRAGVLWVGTDNGLNGMADEEGKAYRRFLGDPANPDSLSHNRIRSIHEDRNGRLWIGTDAGLNRFDRERGTFERYLKDPAGLSHGQVRTIWEDEEGDLWLGTFGGGLNRFDSKTGRFDRYVAAPVPGRLNDNRIYVVFEDHSGVLWVGTNNGLNRCDRARERFGHYRWEQAGRGREGGAPVRALMEDSEGALWVGTEDGLKMFDPKRGRVVTYQEENNTGGSSHREVRTLAQDGKGRIWIGTADGLDMLDRDRRVFTHYRHETRTPGSLSHNRINAVHEDRTGLLWVGTEGGGLNALDRDTGRFSVFKQDRTDPRTLSHDEVTCLAEDQGGALWVGTWSGLNRMERGTGRFVRFEQDHSQSGSLSHNRVFALQTDEEGTLWVGTWRGLNRYDRATERFSVYHEQDGLANEMVYGILDDGVGSLWISTNRGLSRFDLKLERFRNYDVLDGLQDDEFLPRACYRGAKGHLYFGGINGWNAFDPKTIENDAHVPPVAITHVSIFNQKVAETGDDSPFQRALHETDRLDETDRLELSYRDTALSFEFAALHYAAPEKNAYAYQLEGVDRDWVYTNADNRVAAYAHLAPGQYLFRVKGSNKDGIWNEEGAVMRVTIRRPPWKSWWAICLYVIGVAGSVTAYIHAQKKKLALQRKVNEQLIQVDRQKDAFLANTSHELRTPLHGIIGIAESLVAGAAGPLGEKLVSDLTMIVSSGKRLTSLVNDILDFSKLIGKGLAPRKQEVELNALTDIVLTLSRPLLGEKDLRLVNAVSHSLPPVEADEDRLQQILHNLVGNAIKFTENGVIEVSAALDSESLAVSVSDTGVGIPEDELDRIFDSFTQVDGSTERLYGGTGLGLAITKQLIELQGGRIWVSSEPGKGSIFTFTLPVFRGQMETERSGDKARPKEGPRIFTTPAPTSPAVPPHKSELEGGAQILIVDDETINRQVLVNYLALEGYGLLGVSSGAEALRILEERSFDLVLLDIMMPHMSGYEVCREIRKPRSLQELPVIFLTAKNQDADLVEGFDCGANDYLTKPVSKGELLSRVKTHLELRLLNRTLEQKVKERTRELARTNEDLRSGYRELETLNNIVKTINREVELTRVVETLLNQGLVLFPQANKGTVLVWGSEQKQFRFWAATGYNLDSLKEIKMTPEEVWQRYLNAMKRMDEGIFLARDVPALPLSEKFRHLPAPKAMIAMNLSTNKEPLGLLILECGKDSHAFNTLDVKKLSRFREHALTAITKAKVFGDMVEAQKDLIEEAHVAGMAELASTVIHNMGNILNTVKISLHAIQCALEVDRTLNLFEKVIDLLHEHRDNPEAFFTQSGRSGQISQALGRIFRKLGRRKRLLCKEITRIDHQLQAVTALLFEQHKHTHVKRLAEATDVNRLLHEVVQREAYLLKEKKVRLVEEFSPLPLVNVERPKLMHVLFYLLNNAREAIAERKDDKGLIKLQTCMEGDRIIIRIIDNGVGIPPEHLTRVYTHGFTTKKDHQGFGLHYCANTLKEMSFSIEINSSGPDRGTEVILKLSTGEKPAPPRRRHQASTEPNGAT